MPSTVVFITSITTFIGFIINVLVMFLVLSRGRRSYHFLFAVLLFMVACWDLGVFLMMIRNSYPNEMLLYYNIVGIPLAAGALYPVFGWLLNPVFAGFAMALSSVSVVSNSLRIKTKKL